MIGRKNQDQQLVSVYPWVGNGRKMREGFHNATFIETDDNNNNNDDALQ